MNSIKESAVLKDLCYKFKLKIRNNLSDLSKFKEFQDFKDYEYIYCIAYEMLIRTDEYNFLLLKYDNLIKDEDISKNEKQNEIDNLTSQMYKLGLNKNSFIGFDCGDGNIFEKIKNYEEILNSPWSVRTLNKFTLNSTIEFDNVMHQLVFFYHKKNQLYIVDTTNNNNYIKTNINAINAYINHKDLYIPCENEITKEINYKSLSETIYLKDLDKKILEELKEKKNNNLLKQVKLDYKITEIFWYDYLLNDIEYGLVKLINYYLKNKKIKKIEDINSDKITFDEVLFNSNNFQIPCISESDQVVLKTINLNLPLKELEKEFLLSLEFSDLKNSYIETEPIFNRPKLSFDEARLVNLPTNLNLSKEELLLYISQIKDDYDNNKDIVKNSIEYVFDLTLISDNTEMPTNIKYVNELNKSTKRLFPNKRDEFKKSFSLAFYIYDLYKFFLPYFEERREEIRDIKDSDIKEIKEKTKENTYGYNKSKIEVRVESTPLYLKMYENDKLLTEIVYLTNLSREQVEYYLITMKEFIHGVNLIGEKNSLKKVNNPQKYEKPDPKYKNLIIGNSYIIKSNKQDLIRKLID